MRYIAILLSCVATTAIAQNPVFSIPVDCTLGETCYINDYFDRDMGTGTRDYACGDVSRDNHLGVDFALPTFAEMRAGVDILSVASGKVHSIRDGMRDFIKTAPGTPEGPKLDCGNNVAVDHGNGWITRYCHLKQNSVTVSSGDIVERGDILGEVGLSGATNYPHMHFSTYHNGKRVDPFNPVSDDTCTIDAADTALWDTPIPYHPGGFVRIGMAGSTPQLQDIRNDLDSSPDIPADAPIFVTWAHGYTVKSGDVIKAEITGPNGPFWKGETTINRDRKFNSLNYLGRKRGNTLWEQGLYTATVRLIRNGETIAEKTIQSRVVGPTSQ